MDKNLSVNITKENTKQLKRSIPYIIFVSILNLIIVLAASGFLVVLLDQQTLVGLNIDVELIGFIIINLLVILFFFFNFLKLFKYAKSIQNVTQDSDIDQLLKYHISSWRIVSIFFLLVIIAMVANVTFLIAII